MTTITQKQQERIQIAQIKSYIWMTLASLLLFISLILVLTLYQIGGRLNVIAQVFRPFLNQTNRLVLAENLDQNSMSISQINEALIRQFISNRHFFIKNELEMKRRWAPGGIIYWLWYYPEYVAFITEEPDDFIQQKIQESVEFYPYIVSLKEVRPNFWEVGFDIYYVNGDKESYVATFSTRYRPSRVSFSEEIINPVGLEIYNYELRKKEISD